MPLRLSGAIHLVQPTSVIDADLVVTTLARMGELDVETFARAFASDAPPLLVTRELLAGARHALRALEAPAARAAVAERQRLLTRFGTIDAAWLAERAERVARLAGALPTLRETKPPTAWLDRACELVALLHGESSAELLRATAATYRDPQRPFVEDSARTLTFYSLLFRAGDDGTPLRDPAKLAYAAAHKKEAHSIAAKKPTLAQALSLLALPMRPWLLPVVAGWVAEGLPIARLAEANERNLLQVMTTAPSARAADAYLTWAIELLPHYRALDIPSAVSPAIFAKVQKSADVAVLSVCLMEKLPGNASSLGQLHEILGLKRPKHARAGVGREAFPELAAWLDDDVLLDRFVQLARSAGVPLTLSKQLKEDFEHADKVARERAHLLSLPARHERQEARLRTLLASERTKEAAPRTRTKRRLEERIAELVPIAYRRELEGAFREIVRESWGITLTKLTPTWRDAMRFWLYADNNRGHLEQLLRSASKKPGADVKHAFPKNVEWLAKVDPKIDTSAWLAPRRESIEAEGAIYEISLEEDPLEVLRMGMPFGTCLALEDGENAASTVLNAIDANKRVLYVRGAAGRIVARKLLVITKELTLVGYKLYVSVAKPAAKIIRQAVDAFCMRLAKQARVPMAATGWPEPIHAGFWYDDGTVLWGRRTDVNAYCTWLGLPAPATPSESLEDEACGHEAIMNGDVDTALALLSPWTTSPADQRLGDFLVEQLGEQRVVRRAAGYPAPARALLRTLGRPDEEGMARALAVAPRVGDDVATHVLDSLLKAFPRSTRLADALAELAERASARAERSRDHPRTRRLAMLALRMLPAFLDDVGDGLSALDRVAAAWRASLARGEPERTEIAHAERRVLDALVKAFARAPDDQAVVACLTNRRRSTLAQRAALAICAQYTIRDGARAVARLGVLRPELAGDPLLLAAVLRQEGVCAITDAVAKRLPVPTRAPFEALGERLFDIEGLAPLLARWTPRTRKALASWNPSGWQIAWERYRGGSEVREALFAIAAEHPADATRAMELLAILGDDARVHTLERLGRGQEHVELEAQTRAQRWKTVGLCALHSRGAAAVIAEVARGRVPENVMRVEDGHVVDERALAIARRALREGHAVVESAAEQDGDPLEVISAWSRLHPLDLEPEVSALLARGDTRMLVRLLTERATLVSELDAHTMARIWQVEGARLPLAQAITREFDRNWAARVVAAERAGAKLGLASACDGLFETCAAAYLATNPRWALATDTLDELRIVIRAAVSSASPANALKLYGSLPDELSASIFVRALQRAPRDRVAAIRDAANRFEFDDDGAGGESVRKTWLLRDGP